MTLSTKICIWLVLTILFGLGVAIFHFRRRSKHVPLSQRHDNKLGKAMINMERASIFEDYPNFFEFAKYALREAMGLPRGKAGLELSLSTIIKRLEDKHASEEIIEIVREIYETSEKIEAGEDFTENLGSRLIRYYEVIREVNNLFGGINSQN